MHVLLFDIDGTLISTGGAGGAALCHALCEQFQVDKAAEVPFAGRTDRGIASNLFAAHEIDDTHANWEQLRSAYLGHLVDFLPRRDGRVLPGIPSLLQQLHDRTDVAMGLLTGNTRDGARLKLEHYELFDYFADFGGFGDRQRHRNDVAREALSSVHDACGEVASDRVWIIGDTPLDIECARAIGANVLAVATGSHPRDELQQHQPDLLLDHLSDPSRFLSQLALS